MNRARIPYVFYVRKTQVVEENIHLHVHAEQRTSVITNGPRDFPEIQEALLHTVALRGLSGRGLTHVSLYIKRTITKLRSSISDQRGYYVDSAAIHSLDAPVHHRPSGALLGSWPFAVSGTCAVIWAVGAAGPGLHTAGLAGLSTGSVGCGLDLWLLRATWSDKSHRRGDKTLGEAAWAMLSAIKPSFQINHRKSGQT